MGEEQPSNAALLVHLDYIRQDIAQVITRLDKQNGAIGHHESRLAVIESQASDAKTSGAKWGGTVGGLIAGAAMVWQFFQGHGGK
jgi:hypothetical protein